MMIAKVVIAVAGLFALGAGLIQLIHRLGKSDSIQARADWVKYGIFFGIVTVFIVSAYAGAIALGGILAGLIAMAGYEIRKNLERHAGSAIMVSAATTVVIAISLAHLLVFRIERGAAICVFLLLLVFVTDSYAQLIGRLIGRQPLCRRISPNKTVEGFIGSLVMAALSALIFSFLIPGVSVARIIILGIITALSATAGDLIFSTVKRKMGIKDFSSLLPGHGGILDRFDSLIVATPVFFWGRILMDNIPGGGS